MKIGFAQINPTVGDLRGNCELIIGAYERLAAAGAELVLTPELAITGYPPQDLVFKSRFVPENLAFLEKLHSHVGDTALLVGFVDRNEGRGKPFHNAAALLERGKPICKAYKSLLPTYDVFDEDRYFEAGRCVVPFDVHGRKIGVTICEDIWTDDYLPRPLYDIEPVRNLVEQSAEIIVNLSASPFRLGAPACRFEMIAAQARTHQRPICYCNVVGGNDQLIFDGNSIAVNASGNLIAQLAAFREDAKVVDTDSTDAIEFHEGKTPEQLFTALSLGVRDYFRKCNFHSAVIGLSGGVDSAVTAVIAVDALGAENVTGVSMPSPYSSRGSIDDARALARNLGIKFFEIPITDAFRDFKAQFKEIFKGLPENETEENMQPRLRAMTLMALSNKFGHLLLTTGNKSELAVGYCTLYGDMAGGLAVISDVPKTMVYELARWINSDYSARSGAKRQIIPGSTIEKAPSAELKPNQKDQDTLPPYEILDKILQLYVEENLSARDIIARGFDEKTVRWVQRRVDLNEYKREQSAPGLKVTSRAFGVGRKMPIAQRYVD
ncbi:MAG: NAD+ synthase [Verrucomicrobia bacterium 13_1_20CM_4_54_11]|nr:MAG: NAD+ synthase [Verrucomicrobia bacterium 13_1_20CM_4_54_11]OLE12007.1 MAG: NAD+ synthase [Verrucomicrobia bacterium 13_1_20CM_3_54_17]